MPFPFNSPIYTHFLKRVFLELTNKLHIHILSLAFSSFFMEKSMNSVGKPLSSPSNQTNSFEESGWTMYFENFFANNNNNINDDHEHCTFSLDDDSSSLVSDAASLVVKKSAAHKEHAVGLSINGKSGYNRSSFKKRRTEGALVNDALEDTASSPVNSPKVYDLMNQLNKNRKPKDSTHVLQEKGSDSSEVDERGDCDGTELKKKGLCLVPLSMVVNYLG